MRPLLKYLLSLFALLTFGQGMLANAVPAADCPQVASGWVVATGIDHGSSVLADPATPYFVRAHNATPGFSLLEAIELAEEDDKWHVNAFQAQQDDYRPLALWLALTDYHIFNHPHFTSSPLSAQGFPPTVSSCLTFCVLRI